MFAIEEAPCPNSNIKCCLWLEKTISIALSLCRLNMLLPWQQISYPSPSQIKPVLNFMQQAGCYDGLLGEGEKKTVIGKNEKLFV